MDQRQHQLIAAHIRAIIDREIADDPSPDKDTLAAAAMAQWALGAPREREDPVVYLDRVLEALGREHDRYRELWSDPAGYGSATFHAIRRKVALLRERIAKGRWP